LQGAIVSEDEFEKGPAWLKVKSRKGKTMLANFDMVSP
jgi:hypothetical protein